MIMACLAGLLQLGRIRWLPLLRAHMIDTLRLAPNTARSRLWLPNLAANVTTMRYEAYVGGPERRPQDQGGAETLSARP